MQEAVSPVRPVQVAEQGPPLRRMLDAAQRFFACRDRSALHTRWTEPPPVRTLAEAIERDFAGFDLERAEREFRAAMAAMATDPGTPAPLRPPAVEDRARTLG